MAIFDYIPQPIRRFANSRCKQLIGQLNILLISSNQLLLYWDDWLDGRFDIENEESKARWDIVHPILLSLLSFVFNIRLTYLFFDFSATSILESLALLILKKILEYVYEKTYQFRSQTEVLEFHLWRRFSIPLLPGWEPQDFALLPTYLLLLMIWIPYACETLGGQMVSEEYEWRFLRWWVVWVDFARVFIENLPIGDPESPYSSERSMYVMFCFGGLVLNRALIWWYY